MEIRKIEFQYRDDFPIFASPSYLKFLANDYGWLGGFVGGKLLFILPYIFKKKGILRWIQFQTDTLVVGGIVSDGAEKGFLNSVMIFLKKDGVDFVSQSPPYAVFHAYPENSLYAPFGSYVADLSMSEGELWQNIDSKHRNVIRHAERYGVKIEIDRASNEEICGLLQKTMARSGKSALSVEELKQMKESLGNNMRIFTARFNGELQGCAVMPFSRHRAYYLYGGSIERPFLGSLNLLQWEAMKHFKSLGVNSYDFVGARLSLPQEPKLEGIQRFKSRFGGVLERGYLWKYPLKKNKYKLYNALSRIRYGFGGDIIDQERKQAKP